MSCSSTMRTCELPFGSRHAAQKERADPKARSGPHQKQGAYFRIRC